MREVWQKFRFRSATADACVDSRAEARVRGAWLERSRRCSPLQGSSVKCRRGPATVNGHDFAFCHCASAWEGAKPLLGAAVSQETGSSPHSVLLRVHDGFGSEHVDGPRGVFFPLSLPLRVREA